MDAEAVFNRYDIRGDYPAEIDETFAEQLGRAVGTYTVRNGRGKVVVGRDVRDASDAVHGPFIAGVRETGANVVDVGIGTTDRTAVATSHYGGTGVMITASHHPWERTGFKLLYEAGNGFTNDDLDAVKGLFRDAAFETGEGTLLRTEEECDELYRERAVEVFRGMHDGELDVDVLIDTGESAARTAPRIFEELGATVDVYEREDRPDPEPGKGTRSGVVKRTEEYDVAVGYDPDGDRVYLVHPELGWVDGDRLFYALAAIVEPATIVASIDTSPLIEEAGAAVEYTRVGDVFVAAEGRAVDADLLGEPNGHYAVPRFCWYNSGLFASLLLASVADRLPQLLEPVAEYRRVRRTATFETVEARDAALDAVKKQVAQQYEVLSRVDGVKFEGDGFTGLVRPSATSPKLRVIVHAPSDAVDVEAVAERLLD